MATKTMLNWPKTTPKEQTQQFQPPEKEMQKYIHYSMEHDEVKNLDMYIYIYSYSSAFQTNNKI